MRESADRFADPYVPPDLRFLPGTWQRGLPDYYGCIARVDEGVGTILKTLADQGLKENTIVGFLGDHGSHFNTHNVEHKRSPHESSLHIPLIFQGPGFNRSVVVPQLVRQVDVVPTVLEAAGIRVPDAMQGHSAYRLLHGHVEEWRNEVFIMISESMIGRALRKEEWTDAVVVPNVRPHESTSSDHYVEYQLYNLFADPHQLVNLAGRKKYREVASKLCERLQVRMLEAGDREAQIVPAQFYP